MNKREDQSLPAILPVGTAVVSRVNVLAMDGRLVQQAGATGVVTVSPSQPDGAYRVRFPGGEEAAMVRGALEVLSHYQLRGLSGELAGATDLRTYVIYRCIIGSRAYGLERDASDTDRRGVYLPSAEMHWSLLGVPEQLEDEATQEVYWEMEKFVRLALKANPNVLEVLYSPLVEHVSPIGQRLLDMRGAFLSKLIYATYNGYVLSQFKRIEQDLRTRGEIKWKHAMHMIRLLLSGTTALREGCIAVRVTEHCDELTAVRDGQMSWDDLEAWRRRLHLQFDAAFAATTLPELPDYRAADALLIEARRSMVK